MRSTRRNSAGHRLADDLRDCGGCCCSPGPCTGWRATARRLFENAGGLLRHPCQGGNFRRAPASTVAGVPSSRLRHAGRRTVAGLSSAPGANRLPSAAERLPSSACGRWPAGRRPPSARRHLAPGPGRRLPLGNPPPRPSLAAQLPPLARPWPAARRPTARPLRPARDAVADFRSTDRMRSSSWIASSRGLLRRHAQGSVPSISREAVSQPRAWRLRGVLRVFGLCPWPSRARRPAADPATPGRPRGPLAPRRPPLHLARAS